MMISEYFTNTIGHASEYLGHDLGMANGSESNLEETAVTGWHLEGHETCDGGW